MVTKIRRSLYIGLGGTGMKALLHTQKMFIDTYGEVPPMIGFLGIDTDGGEFTQCNACVCHFDAIIFRLKEYNAYDM